MENVYEKRVAYMLDVYMERTNIKWEDLKYLILKDKNALDFFDKEFIEYADLREAANVLIGLTLLKKVDKEDLKSKIDIGKREERIIELLKSEKIEFLEDENFLEDFYEYTKHIKC